MLMLAAARGHAIASGPSARLLGAVSLFIQFVQSQRPMTTTLTIAKARDETEMSTVVTRKQPGGRWLMRAPRWACSSVGARACSLGKTISSRDVDIKVHCLLVLSWHTPKCKRTGGESRPETKVIIVVVVVLLQYGRYSSMRSTSAHLDERPSGSY